MKTCDLCRYWNPKTILMMPGKGECTRTNEDGDASFSAKALFEGNSARFFTGPKYGCVHFEAMRADSARFSNTTGRVRWNRGILEQQMYANFDETGKHLKEPEIKWVPVEEATA